MAAYNDYINQINTTYAISDQPQDPSSQQTTSYGVFPGQAGHPSDQPAQTKPVAFFLFFNCKCTGTSIHRDDIVEMAVQSWPYIENAPLFQSKVDNTGGQKGRRQDRKKKGQKKPHPDDIQGQPFPVVWKLFMQWLERIVNHATSIIGTQIYPVLVSHHGDTYDFHFLFRAFENYGIDLRDPANLDIHFCDPVPLLQQYKDYAHPWLIESKSMAIGSLLNDWLPGQFDIGDLYICPGKTWLTAKLYTQTPMYHLLQEFPLYTTDEWIEYYQEVKQYKEDKKSLEDNFPTKIADVQRKFAVRSLLQWGYNWDGLIELYKSCSSPHHFRQELKDCDVKSGAASQLTWKFTEMDLPQDGTREYIVRIKKNMPPQRYTHLTDRRGRWWILRVKNELPPCVFSPDQVLPDIPSRSQWKVPENLLLIRFPEAWFPMPGETPNADEVIDQMHLDGMTFDSDDDSGDSWDPVEDEEAALRQSLQPLEELIKEQPKAPPVTSFTFGDESTAFNPFTDRGKQQGLQYELREGERAKHREGLWASIKTEEKEEPSSFGQVIKFCRPQMPAGAEESLYRCKKTDKEEDKTDKNRKGYKGKNKGKRGNNKGGQERSFGRSQSWTGDNNEKPNQPKPRTVSCGVAEDWEEEDTSFELARQTKSEEILPQEKAHEHHNAAAHRMVNFHLNKNSKKSSRNRRNRKGHANNKPESVTDDDKMKQTQSEESCPSSLDKSKEEGLSSDDKSIAVSSDSKITFVSRKRDMEKDSAVKSTAWGQKEADMKPPPWGPICNGTDGTKPQVTSFTFYNSKKGGNQTQSILQGKRPNWGKRDQDSNIGINQVDLKPQISNKDHAVKSIDKPNAWSKKTIDSTKHESKLHSGYHSSDNHLRTSEVNQDGADRIKRDMGDNVSSVDKFGQKRENNTGLRLPKKASKAQTVASKEVKSHPQFGSAHNETTQQAADLNNIVLGQSRKGIQSFNSQREINNKPNSKDQSWGSSRNQKGFGQRNNRNFEQMNRNVGNYRHNPRGGNKNWNQPPQSMPSSTPAVVATNGDTENWEDEVDEYYGY